MIRDSIDDPWKEVSWEEAVTYTANALKLFRPSMAAPA